MFLRELLEARPTTAAIMFGRFNPPHFGHVDAWRVAANFPVWYIGTNQSTQGPKDPLPFEIKIEAMNALYPEIEGHLVAEQNWFTLAVKVFKELGGNITLKIVTDPEDKDIYVPMIQKQNGLEGPHGYYKFQNIEWERAERKSEASLVRKAVKENNPADFKKYSGTDPNMPIAGRPYFELVRKYMLPYMQAEEQELKRKQERDRIKAEKEKAKAEKEKAKAEKKNKEQNALSEFSRSGRDPWDDDGGEDAYKYPKPKHYERSIDFFGQFEADHFDDEKFDKETGVFKGYWDDEEGRVQIAYFKFDDADQTGSDDPGMGWYYEPQTEGVAEDAEPMDREFSLVKKLGRLGQRIVQNPKLWDKYEKEHNSNNPDWIISLIMDGTGATFNEVVHLNDVFGEIGGGLGRIIDFAWAVKEGTWEEDFMDPYRQHRSQNSKDEMGEMYKSHNRLSKHLKQGQSPTIGVEKSAMKSAAQYVRNR